MSYRDFHQSIDSPDLQAIAVHWEEVRGGRSMPGWSDIDPIVLGRCLRYVWSWKYDRERDSFTGRLAGGEIDLAFGKSLRGAAMTDFFSPEAYRLVFPRHRRVVTEPAFMQGTGMVFHHVNRLLVGERIIMPLASDGVHGDGIIGATVYRESPEWESGRPIGPDFTPERVTFYPLDPT